jgi:hypothetical protein
MTPPTKRRAQLLAQIFDLQTYHPPGTSLDTPKATCNMIK